MVRFKNRYLVVDLYAEGVNRRYLSQQLKQSGNKLLVKELENMICSSFGPATSGPILASMQVRVLLDVLSAVHTKKQSGEQQEEGKLLAIIRCNREHSQDVRAAVTMLTSVAGCRVACSVIKVKGSPRTMAQEQERLLAGTNSPKHAA